jgi:hypothetical protein
MEKYPNYLIHYNKNHSSKNGQFTRGDGDGDGIANDHTHQSKIGSNQRILKRIGNASKPNYSKTSKNPTSTTTHKSKLTTDQRVLTRIGNAPKPNYHPSNPNNTTNATYKDHSGRSKLSTDQQILKRLENGPTVNYSKNYMRNYAESHAQNGFNFCDTVRSSDYTVPENNEEIKNIINSCIGLGLDIFSKEESEEKKKKQED